MDRLPNRLAGAPTFLTTQLATHAHRLASEAFETAGARGYHYRALATLAEHGPLSQADLGRSVNMDRSDVVAAMSELEALGQVERHPDPDDGRRRMVRITTAGRRQLGRLDRALSVAQEGFLAPLATGDRARLTSLMATLLAHHAGDGPSGTGRS